MEQNREIRFGVGFVTGRKSFRKVLKTYMYRWKYTAESISERVRPHLFVAYDLDYSDTQIEDYVNIRQDILESLDQAFFIGQSTIANEIRTLVGQGVVSGEDAQRLFSKGYAGKRNAVLYFALKNKMDYLIFLDDDEYPLAVSDTPARSTAIWSGQDVLNDHLQYLQRADFTNGLHCGYISPIPYLDFNGTLTEDDFRLFIEAISNDILEWDKMKRVMENGGITYADTAILESRDAQEVEEVNHTKFISGSNLGISFRDPTNVLPFYNPPGARGEDTFLSTCLSERTVLRIPTYTFHDGFGSYMHLLDGVLPLQLKRILAEDERVVTRFYRACLGWIRYKPLYLFITQPDRYHEEAGEVRRKLAYTVPKLCAYFGNPKFKRIIPEFERYAGEVHKHFEEFTRNSHAWEKIRRYALENAY